MALSFVGVPHWLCPTPTAAKLQQFHKPSTSTSTLTPFFPSFSYPFVVFVRAPRAIGPDGKFYPSPADDDPPEADEDSSHGFSTFQQIQRQAQRARQIEEEDYKNNQSTYLAAIADVEDAPDNAPFDSSEDDLFGEIDKALALKRKEFVSQGLLQPNPPTHDHPPP